MAQTKEGALKARISLIERYGSEEALRQHYSEIGGIGGARSKSGGFASTAIGDDGLTGPQRASRAGALGGAKSRRTKKSPISDSSAVTADENKIIETIATA